MTTIRTANDALATPGKALKPQTPIQARPRKIVRQTRGTRHGPITRLMSPGDLGQLLKPFVFLDLFDMEKTSFPRIGLHPHSGIATVTYLFEGSVRYGASRPSTIRLAGSPEHRTHSRP